MVYPKPRWIVLGCLLLSGGACGKVAGLDAFVLHDRAADAGFDAGDEAGLEASADATLEATEEGGQDVGEAGICTEDSKDCVGQTPRTCGADGQWVDGSPCVDQACVDGTCVGECAPGTTRCWENALQVCLASGTWDPGAACDGAEPICSGGKCVAESVGGPSCTGLPATCGPTRDANCCASTAIPGGTFNRGNIASYPATVSDFRMDVYEVTVGRFRRFVESGGGTQQNPPVDGDGANPHLGGSGWQDAWNTELPLDTGTLKNDLKCYYSTIPPKNTWTDEAAENENRPISCVTWYEAFAFCAWDGGRIPTEAEWNYAAAGGSEQRYHPWSEPPGNNLFDCSDATHVDCGVNDVPEVGALSPKGDGRWGQANLGDGMWEWVLDYYAEPYVTPCSDCANLSLAADRAHRGGCYYCSSLNLSTAYRDRMHPGGAVSIGGVRCVRAP